jgi:hypothetical protein
MTRTLAELPYKEKDEILDWTCIPAGSCDMNFRPASAHPTGDIREVVVLLVQVATIAGCFGLALRYLIGPFMTSWISLGLAVGIGTALALADLWAGPRLWPNPFSQLPRRWPSAVLFGLPLLFWLVAAWLSRPVPVLGPFSLLLMIVIGQISSLFLAAVARTPRLRTATRLVAEMLEHWHRYGRDRLYPPWVFQMLRENGTGTEHPCIGASPIFTRSGPRRRGPC